MVKVERDIHTSVPDYQILLSLDGDEEAEQFEEWLYAHGLEMFEDWKEADNE